MNWKLRLMNKTTLLALVGVVVAAIYQVLGIIGVLPPISQEEVIKAAGLVITILVSLGIVVDPTTDGVADSERGKHYTRPYREGDEIAND